jgi:uncharacterized protein DUF6390
MRTSQVPAGHRLFAQYAHAPNARGYCGPPGVADLLSVASGDGERVDVPSLAARFSGAWPYQQVLADLAGVVDPLDENVVRAYWTGNELTDRIDRAVFGEALLSRIRPQARHYWAHLDDSLLLEAAPTHAFHVLAVYPWSRLLGSGQPEPLEVLDSCRIGWATVIALESAHLVVRTRHLEYRDTSLFLGHEQEDRVGYRVNGAAFINDVKVGDHVAVHWGFACDRLTDEQVRSLERWTNWQLEAMAPRLAGARPAPRPAAAQPRRSNRPRT